MDALYYQPKDSLPGISLDKESGTFEIVGTSCPMDGFEFYNPVFEWFDQYFENPLEKTIMDLKLTYFNTVSSKFLLRILTKLNKLTELGHEVKIRWFYDSNDDHMREEGEEFENILNVDFEMISLNKQNEKLKTDTFFNNVIDDIIDN